MFTGTHTHLMASYNQWMNERLYAACATLSEEQRADDMGLFFRSIHATLEHLIWADRAWLARFGVGTSPGAPSKTRLYPEFGELRAARAELDERTLRWAEALTPEWLNEPMTWTSGLYGFTQTHPRWVQVAQLFNHQTHHRGQVHAALTRLGVDMGPTDLPLTPLLQS